MKLAVLAVLAATLAVASAQYEGWYYARAGEVYFYNGTSQLVVDTNGGTVNAIAGSSGTCSLFVGGSFTTANGVSRTNFAVYTQESIVDAEAPEVSGTVNVMRSAGAGVLVGGSFDTAGTQTATGLNLAEFSSGTFTRISTGNTFSGGAVSTLFNAGARVLIGGDFNSVSNVAESVGLVSYVVVDEIMSAIGNCGVTGQCPLANGENVQAVAEFNGAVFIGCNDCNLGPNSAPVATEGLARFQSNAWATGWTLTGTNSVTALLPQGNHMWIAGTFGTCGLAVMDTNGDVTEVAACPASRANGDFTILGNNGGSSIIATGAAGDLYEVHLEGGVPTFGTPLNDAGTAITAVYKGQVPGVAPNCNPTGAAAALVPSLALLVAALAALLL